jgi:transposase
MNSSSYCSGIDVSKPYLDLHLLPTEQAWRFTNDATGHRKLVRILQKHLVHLVVLEATGGYERAAVVAMVNAGLRVHVAQPQIIRAFAVSLKIRAKNDDIDSAICARYAQDRGHELQVIESIDPTQQTLQALLVRRGQLVEMSTMEQNRLQQTSDKQTRQCINRMLKFLEKQIKSLEKKVDEIIRRDPSLREKSKTLQQTRGVGPQTTRVLLACLPELGSVDAKQLNALVGVAPYAHDSGNHNGPRHIAGGRKLVRNGLYMACMSAIQTNPVIIPYYQKLVERGLAHKTAMMACIRKLLNYLNNQLRRLKPAPAQGRGEAGMG